MIGENLDLSDSYIKSYVEKLNIEAKQNYQSMILISQTDRAYLWEDLPMETGIGTTPDERVKSAQITSSFNRLKTMAFAYNTEGGELYRNEEMKKEIIAGWDYLVKTRYNGSGSQYGNWWDWQIGAPIEFLSGVMVMSDELNFEQVQRYSNAANEYSPVCSMTGANLMDIATVVAMNGVLTSNPVKLSNMQSGIKPIFEYVKTGDGFYIDGSYIHHDALAYTEGYGSVLYEKIGQFISVFSNSSWQIKYNDASENMIFETLFSSIEPLLYNGLFMDMTRARSVTRKGWTGDVKIVEGGADNSSKAIEVSANGNAETTIPELEADRGLEVIFAFKGNGSIQLKDLSKTQVIQLKFIDGKFYYQDNVIGEYLKDNWNYMKMKVNMQNETFSVYLGETKVAKDLKFSGKSISILELSAGSNPVKFDNILVRDMEVIPPTAPSELKCLSYGSDYVNLEWNASTDNSSIIYTIYANDIKIASTEEINYKVENLNSETEYKFKVIAIDLDENESLESNIITIKTLNKFLADYYESFDEYLLNADVTKGEIGKWIVAGNTVSSSDGTATIAKNPISGSSDSDYVLRVESKNNTTEIGAAKVLSEELSGKNTFIFNVYLEQLVDFSNFNIFNKDGKQAVTIMLTKTENGYTYKTPANKNVKFAEFKPKQWQQFCIITDGQTNKFDIYVDGELKVKDISFRNNGVNSINKISVNAPKGGIGTIYANDISYVRNAQIPTEKNNIISVKDVIGIDVKKDTLFSQLQLPAYVEAVLDNNTTINLKVNWKETGYSPSSIGKQTLIGDFILPASITNTTGMHPKIVVNVVADAQFIKGDIDRDSQITSNDGSLVLQHIINENTFNLDEEQKYLADMDEDRFITTNDAALILLKVINSIFK